MKKALVVSFVLVAFLSSLCVAEIFKVITIDNEDFLVNARDKQSGKPLWASKGWGETVKQEGTTYIKKFDKGAGIKDNNKYQVWEKEYVYFYEGTRVVPYYSKETYKDSSGNALTEVVTTSDRAKKIVTVQKNEKIFTFPFDDDLVDIGALGMCLSNMDFAGQKDFVFHMLARDPKVFKMTLKFLGTETVALGDKQLECYKVQMIPDLGALNLIGAFVPKTYFWYTKAEPNKFVRYEGLDGGLGTPYIVEEADPKMFE